MTGTQPVTPIVPASRRTSRRRRAHPERFLAHVALLLICGGFLLPLVWMLSTSLKPLDQTMEFPPRFVPQRVELWHVAGAVPTPVPQNYVDVINSEKFDFPRST